MDATLPQQPSGPQVAPATTAASRPATAPLGAADPSTLPVGAALLLAALAAVALLAARRRRRGPRLVDVVETASLGPKRSLVVARMGDELLLLGASEGGVSLLATRPAPPVATAAPTTAGPQAESAPRLGRDSAVQGLLARLGRPRPSPPSFDRLLAESAEDVELRRKLGAGQAGSVR